MRNAAHRFAVAFGVILASVVCMFMRAPAVHAAPVTFTVTNTNDSGAGSLRAAITSANSNGNPNDQDRIFFNIATSGDVIIEPLSTLTISQSVLIDGYTQSDAEPNTAVWPEAMDGLLRVQINNSESGAIEITAPDVTLRGLVIGRSTTSEIVLTHADRFALLGSYINTDNLGLQGYRIGEPTEPAILVKGTTDVRFGSGDPADRNVHSYCMVACVQLESFEGDDSTGAIFQGNFFGIGSDAVTDQGNTASAEPYASPILLKAGSNGAIIGGVEAGEGNSFEHTIGSALLAYDVSDMSVLGNRFLGNIAAAPNRGIISLFGVTDSYIGNSNVASKNIIAGTTLGSNDTIYIADSPDTDAPSQNIQIRNNNIGLLDDQETIYGNYGSIKIKDNSEEIFIDSNVIAGSLGAQGVVIADNAQKVAVTHNAIYDNFSNGIDINGNNNAENNDDLDSDTGPNGILNYPGYTQIVEDSGNTTVTYTIDVPAGNYRIEFYSNDAADGTGNGEGQTYLGYDNITSQGNGLEEFTHTLTGVNFQNMALTATEIDPTTSSGYGATSEFGSEGEVYVHPADIAIVGELLNPEDYSTGNTLSYQFTVTNYGPGTFDISQFNEITPENGLNLATLILPSNLTNATASGDVTCIYLGDGSASFFGPILTNHQDYGISTCGYTGSGPRILESGESVQFTLSAEVANDAIQDFDLYALLNVYLYDPDQPAIAYAAENTEEFVDFFIGNQTINNFAVVTSNPIDLSTSKQLITQGPIVPGQKVTYRLSLTNNGPGDIDISSFDGSGDNPIVTSLFVDILPPNLEYESENSDKVNCTWAGPGSASLALTLFSEHSEFSLVLCSVTADELILTSGESFSIDLITTATSAPDGFTNYVMNAGNERDKEYRLFLSDITNGRELVSTAINRGYNNFSLGAYTNVTNSGGSGGGSGAGSFAGGLSETGAKTLVIVPVVLMASSVIALVFISKKGRIKKIQITKNAKKAISVAAVVLVGVVVVSVWWPSGEKSTTKKIVYDGTEKRQDITEGLISIPKDATSNVCAAVPAANVELAIGEKTTGARVSIPTSTTAEGVVSACAYAVKDKSSSSVNSVIITRREFKSANGAQNAYKMLVKIPQKDRTIVGSNAYYLIDSGQIVIVKDNTLTTVSVARGNTVKLDSAIFKKFIEVLQ